MDYGDRRGYPLVRAGLGTFSTLFVIMALGLFGLSIKTILDIKKNMPVKKVPAKKPPPQA